MNPEPCDVLVLGADEHTGLAAARNLYREGIRVLGGGLDPKEFGFRSRALKARFIHPAPETDRSGFIQCVREAALRHQVRAILPSLDTALMALHEERKAFEGVASLGIAPPEALEIVLNKGRLQDLASSLGVEMPRTFFSGQDPKNLPPDLPLPAIVKQKDSGRVGPRKVIYCATRNEVVSALHTYLQAGCTPLVQELVYGYGVQLVGLCRGGELIQTFQYRRVHEYSCRGGLGALTISEAVDPALLSRSARLLRALKWEGIVGVEFKMPDPRPTCPRLMEINARFIGFIDLAMAAGINFPLLQYRLSVGEEIPTAPIPYRAGVRHRRWLLDTLAVIEILFDRPEVTGVPLPGRVRALWDYLAAYGPHVGSENFQLWDPLPGAVNIRNGLPVAARKLFRALRGRRSS